MTQLRHQLRVYDPVANSIELKHEPARADDRHDERVDLSALDVNMLQQQTN
jgi:hypothetical protein